MTCMQVDIYFHNDRDEVYFVGDICRAFFYFKLIPFGKHPLIIYDEIVENSELAMELRLQCKKYELINELHEKNPQLKKFFVRRHCAIKRKADES